jgi:hypothetical protein
MTMNNTFTPAIRQTIFDALEGMRSSGQRSVLLPSPPVDAGRKFWRAVPAKDLLSAKELEYLMKKKGYAQVAQVSHADVCEMIGWENAIDNEVDLVLSGSRVTLF